MISKAEKKVALVTGAKTAINAVTVHYGRSLVETSTKVNGAAPGHVATGFNGFRDTRNAGTGRGGGDPVGAVG
jgi:NAD(P)-dependent dehydrogenase (short-subunit alcohol dehydrogenase family)